MPPSELAILDPSFWTDEVAARFGAVEMTIAARAADLLFAAQERHVPLTPRLAVSLAQLERRNRPADDLVWGPAFDRAAEAIGTPGRLGRTRFWVASFDVFRSRVAEPVILEAARRTGTVSLIAAAGLPDRGKTGQPDFAHYCAGLDQQVRAVLTDGEIMGQAFWAGTAISLYGWALRKPNRRRAVARPKGRLGLHLPPEPDQVLAQLVFSIEAEFDQAVRRKRDYPKPKARAERLRAGIRPKEGGVTGITHTRRLEDLADALHSEFALPGKIMIQKLLDEGFLMRLRPPLRRPRRDLLAVMHRDGTVQDDGARIVKAAWADAMLRLRIILARMQMTQSDLGWVEAVPGGIRASVIGVEGFTAPWVLDPYHLNGQLRCAQITSSSLMPDFFDLLPGRFDDADPRSSVLQRSMRAVLEQLSGPGRQPGRRLRRRAKATAMRKTSATQHEVRDYAAVFGAVVRPMHLSATEVVIPDWRTLRVELVRELGLDQAPRYSCAALYYPAEVTRGAVFSAYSDAGADTLIEIPVSEAEDPRQALEQTLGRLSEWIINTTLEAVHA